MTVVVLLALAAMWAILLVPGWIRTMRERSGRQTSIDAFHQQLDVMGRYAPKQDLASPPGARLRVKERFSNHERPRSTVPQDSGEAAVRRRDIVVLLAIVAVVTLVGWFVSGLPAVGIAHVVADLLLGGYLYLIVLRRRVEAERMAKIHYLPRTGAVTPEPTRLRRRPAN